MLKGKSKPAEKYGIAHLTPNNKNNKPLNTLDSIDKRTKMKIKETILVLVGVVLFAILLINADTNKLIETLSLIRIDFLVYSILANTVVTLIKVFKWKIIVDFKSKIGFIEAIQYFLIGFFFSILTPGRIGDLMRAKYLRKKTGTAYSITSVIVDRIIDIGLLLLFGFVALILTTRVFGETFDINLIAIALTLFAASILVVSNERIMKKIFLLLHKHFIPKNFKEKAMVGFEKTFNAINLLKSNPKLLLKSIFLGVISWLGAIVTIYLLALALNIDIPLYAFFVILPIISLADILPISVGGLGSRDLIMIYLLSLFFIAYENAIALSIMYFFTGYLLVGTIGLVIFLYRNSKKGQTTS